MLGVSLRPCWALPGNLFLLPICLFVLFVANSATGAADSVGSVDIRLYMTHPRAQGVGLLVHRETLINVYLLDTAWSADISNKSLCICKSQTKKWKWCKMVYVPPSDRKPYNSPASSFHTPRIIAADGIEVEPDPSPASRPAIRKGNRLPS